MKNLSWIQDLRELREWGELPEEFDRWLQAGAQLEDEELLGDLAQIIKQEALPHLLRGWKPFPDRPGEIRLGTPPGPGSRRQIRVPAADFTRGTLVTGTPGSGKTTFLRASGLQFMFRGVPVHFFDFKGSYRTLLSHPEIAGNPDRLLVLSVSQLRFNPLKRPPGVPLENWVAAFLDAYSESWQMMTASVSFLLRVLKSLYERCAPQVPSFYELRAALEELRPQVTRSPEREYLHRTLNRIEAIIDSLGSVLDCQEGFLPSLLDRSVVFEMDGRSEEAESFLVALMLRWDYLYKRFHPEWRGPQLRHLRIFDDCQRVFRRLPYNKLSSVGDILSRIREFQTGVVVAVHLPSVLDPSVPGNTALKVCLSLGSGQDANWMGACLGLDRRQMEQLRRGFPPGQGILKTLGWDPVRFQAPQVALPDQMPADWEARQQAALAALPVVSRVRPAAPAAAETREEGAPTWKEEALLRHIQQVPHLAWSRRQQELKRSQGLSDAASRKIRERVVRRGWVEEVKARKGGGRGSTFLALVLTPEGREYLRSQGVSVGKAGRGNALHRFWVEVARAYFENQDYVCEIEADLTATVWVDLLARKEGQRIVVEFDQTVETGIHNLRKLQPLGVGTLFLTAETPQMVEKIRHKAEQELGPEALEGVRFQLIQEFLEPVSPTSKKSG